MKVSAVDFGVASWITPSHLKELSAHGLSLGKLAKNIAAFEIIDGFIDAQGQRLAGHKVSSSSKAPMTIYGAGKKGKSSLEVLVQDCLAAADFMAIA
jgi:hypothetical protein